MKKKIIAAMALTSLVLVTFGQLALANDYHGRDSYHKSYHKSRYGRGYGRSFYHYPRARYYIYLGRYYYYPRKYSCQYDYYASRHNRDYLPITVVTDMASKGVPAEVIISEIERTGSIYKLDSATISYLKNNKVSDKVIDYMLETARSRR